MTTQPIAPQLQSLSKSEIHDRLGANFSARVQKFCKECDRKGLIKFVSNLEAKHGSVESGLQSLATQYPTEIKLFYINDGFDLKYDNRTDTMRRIPKQYVENHPQPSLWSEWLDVLPLVNEYYTTA